MVILRLSLLPQPGNNAFSCYMLLTPFLIGPILSTSNPSQIRYRKAILSCSRALWQRGCCQPAEGSELRRGQERRVKKDNPPLPPTTNLSNSLQGVYMKYRNKEIENRSYSFPLREKKPLSYGFPAQQN